MKRVVLATTALVVAGGMAVADVAVTGSAELGAAGTKGKAGDDGTPVDGFRLHRDIRVKFGLSGETDTGLSFGASADFHNAGKYRAGGTEGAVHVTGAFGTLTLGNTDGAFDKALTELDAGGALTDDHTGHPGFNGNSGLDGFTDNGGSILRYDYTIGGITTSISGEHHKISSTSADGANTQANSRSAFGAGVAWSGDVAGVGMGVGIGYQSGKKTVLGADNAVTTDDARHKASILGASVSVDLGNGISLAANHSRKGHDIVTGAAGAADDDSDTSIAHSGMQIAYTVGDITVALNGGSSKEKVTGHSTDLTDDNRAYASREVAKSGVGVSVVYGLGEGVSFKVGVGSGRTKTSYVNANATDTVDKESSWSAGLAFSF
ncbi:MAG: porin [Rhodobacteraceae bacterium]|nr:porin [Paracoccaceae bacterium]